MKIRLDDHAVVRAKEHGANEEEIFSAVETGENFIAKRERTGFRKNFAYKAMWGEKYYENKQLEVFAVEKNEGWLVITVIVKYF